MSDTLQPSGDVNPEAAPRPAAGPKRAPPKLWVTAFAVGLGALAIVMLAGVPSASRRPQSHTPRVSALPAADRGGELSLGFADLREPVDPVTRQRPTYPTTAELATRLDDVTGWETAALFVLDATPAELHAAGVEDPDVCVALNSAPMSESFPLLRHWKLVLLDDQQRIMGSTLFEVPTLEVEQLATGDDTSDKGPVLERRFPDWPRAKVFKRLGPGAQSDG